MSEKQTMGFQAEVKQLLQLMIHSLYSNKEIFLRELISNASDASDKLRFEAINQPELYENDSELQITVDFDKAARTITISDNGIGMSKEEAISHLGTIAKSGTKEFFGKLSGDQQKDAALIGQFGVGFYSAYLVANKVVVISKNNDDEQYRWESIANATFTITKDVILEDGSNKIGRGTKIILHLKDECVEYLEERKLKDLIKKHSEFISFPISLQIEKTTEKEISDDEEEE